MLAAQLETIKYIVESNRSPVLTEARRKFAELRRNDKLAVIAREDDNLDSAQVALYLNQFEVAAIGIVHKAFDETVYRDWFEGTYIRAWGHALPYISERRNHKNDNDLYHHFGELAGRWDKERRSRASDRGTDP